MYQCPNCAANLRFSIQHQALFCDACGTVMNPYDMVKDRDAEQNTVFEVNVFTCPQCGGELITEDTEATAFCSFCGGSTILDSRISSVKRPQYIVPFQVSKQDCIESYKKMIKGAVFAPNEVKNSDNIESFRGIYMPYWSYHLEKKGPVVIKGTKSYQRGDYKYTEHHDLSTDVDVVLDNVSFDASSNFSDDLSEGIAPFDQTKQIPFTPSFLSGFYADSNDLNAGVYAEDAENVGAEKIYNQLTKEPPISKYSLNGQNAKNAVKPTCLGGSLVMLPVWFMSLRTQDKGKDRVSYFAVNGQTGRVVGDVPISLKKYVMVSSIVGLIIFGVLNFLLDLTINARNIFYVPTALCLVMYFVYRSREKKINARMEGTDDKGLQAAKDKTKTFSNGTSFADASINAQNAMDYQQGAPDMYGGQNGMDSQPQTPKQPEKKKKEVKKKTFVWIPLIASVILYFVNPVTDTPYYLVTFLSMLFMIWMIIRTVGRFNELTTRKLPQFNRTGGDDNVQR